LLDLADGPTILILGLLLTLWLTLAWYASRLYYNAREEGDILSGLAWDLARLYARFFHRLSVHGRENIPPGPSVDGRPILVIANHTAGLDPILIQAVCPWFIRWMMAADMTGKNLEWLWHFTEVILVDRSGKAEVSGMRAALGTLARGHAVGVFPEGKLRTSPNMLHPFMPGAALLISRSNALVLPVIIRGTPFCQSSWASLAEPSRSSLEFLPLIDFAALGLRSSEMMPHLEAAFRDSLAQNPVAALAA